MQCFLSATTVVVLLVLGGVTSEKPTQDYPEALARFLYMINGDFSAEVKTTDKDGNPLVNYYYLQVIPLKVPGLTDPTALWFLTNPDKYLYLLFTLTEDSNEIVYINVYEVQLDVDVLIRLKAENKVPSLPLDIDMKYRCKGVFEEDDSGAFNGSWEDCEKKNGADTPIVLARNITCDSFTDIHEWGTRTSAHNYVRYGERYPLPPEVEEKMKSTKDPCQS